MGTCTATKKKEEELITKGKMSQKQEVIGSVAERLLPLCDSGIPESEGPGVGSDLVL